MSSDEGARVLRQEVAPSLLKTTSHPAIPIPAPLTPLGTLSILPRELRDEIYRNVCNQDGSYWFNTLQGHEPSDCRKWDIENLSMLQVCKVIRKEFLSVLCSEGVFEISCHYNEIRSSDIPFVKDISNLCFVFNLGMISSTSVKKSRLSTMEEGPVSFFTGTSVLRNKCVVEITWCTPNSLLILGSPLMAAMAQLTGFKTVELVFLTDADSWLEFGTPWDVKESFRNLKTCPGFDTFVLRISKALERTLGPYTTGENLDKPQYWTQSVVFHPQGPPLKQVERTKAKGVTQMDEASSALFTSVWVLPCLDNEA